VIVALLDKIVVDLSRAEDQLLDAVGLLAGGSFVGNDALEATALVEVLEGTTCEVGMLLARVSPSLIAITMTQPAANLPPRNLGCRAMPVGKASAEEASPTPIDTDLKVRRR